MRAAVPLAGQAPAMATCCRGAQCAILRSGSWVSAPPPRLAGQSAAVATRSGAMRVRLLGLRRTRTGSAAGDSPTRRSHVELPASWSMRFGRVARTRHLESGQGMAARVSALSRRAGLEEVHWRRQASSGGRWTQPPLRLVRRFAKKPACGGPDGSAIRRWRSGRQSWRSLPLLEVVRAGGAVP